MTHRNDNGEPMLVVAVGAVRDVARRPGAIVFCAIALLLSQVILRASSTPLQDQLIATLAWGDLPSSRSIGLVVIGLIIGTLWVCAGVAGALAATLSDRSLACGLLGGISSLPAACTVVLLASLAIAGVALAGLLCVERAASFGKPGSLLRAIMIAMALAPTVAGIWAIALAALLSIARLANDDQPSASPMPRGVLALTSALSDLLNHPTRATGLTLSLLLVNVPLLLLSLLGFLAAPWIQPLPASIAVQLVHCLTLAACLLVTATGLHKAIAQSHD